MQQHPGASLRFHFMARRTESPNDVTTSYATASRCITTVPFRGETGRITTCRYKILRPVSHPPIVHSFVGTARTSGAVPPALNATLRFLFRGETDRITKRSDHQICNSIQVRHDGSFFLPRRTESPGRSFISIQMFHTHTNSPTITPPSLLYFLFPSCFSVLSLSLEKLVTCGVTRCPVL